MMHRADSSRPRSGAFTLLELVFVLVIISTTLALAAPSLRGWSRGSKLRDTGDEFLAITRYARCQAIAGGQVYRLYVDGNAGTYQLMAQQQNEFVQLGNSWGRQFKMPDGFRLTMTGEGGGPLEAVEFYPSGRTQVARVRITSDQNDITELQCPTPAEGFRVLTSEEMSRP
jgi:hypothetical protein